MKPRVGAPIERVPTNEERALYPDLVKQMLATIATHVDQFDIEHCVVVGITTEGNPRLFHSYGVDLPMSDVCQLLEDIAAVGRKQIAEGTPPVQ